MKIQRRHLLIAAGAAFGLFLLGVLSVLGAYLYVAPDLPSVEALRDVRLAEPMRVYTADGKLVAEFGEQKRVPLDWPEIPPRVVDAFLSAEDDRFFQHPGVDWQGLLRAGINHLITGDRSQGGGTITMLVAREFFLTREKTYIRKIREIFLAFRIESELTKEEILTLFLNKIYLGNRSYGVAAASLTYYGTDVREISIAQAAGLAATAQRPSENNPASGTSRFAARRAYVLGRMLELEKITQAEHEEATQEPTVVTIQTLASEVDAPYVAEMARSEMLRRFGDDAYTLGLRAYLTVDSKLQEAAIAALRLALHEYDFRHGYRGPLRQVDLESVSDTEARDALLADERRPGVLVPALIVEVGERSARAYLGAGTHVELAWEALSWARPITGDGVTGPPPRVASDLLAPGDVVSLLDLGDERGWYLSQRPEVQGALVSLDSADGSILALTGGYDFGASQFNRAAQATRQPGSSFKPFIYSAALERGFTAATVVNDAPVVFEEDEALERDWRPKNDDGRFYGPTRLREALTFSRNLVSIRILRSIGAGYTVGYLQRFGFDRARLPRDLSLALGSAVLSPLEMATAYSVFANGGFRVQPYLLQRVEMRDGSIMFEADPARACAECENEPPVIGTLEQPVDDFPLTEPPMNLAERVVDAENAFLVDDMLRDVVQRGTGRRARVLGRTDLAGKTGSTNDHTDAWFSGYAAGIVSVAWVGYDRQRTLGDDEYGGRAALPMWIDYMRVALAGVPERPQLQPPGIVTARISAETGMLAGAGEPNALFEFFRASELARLEAEARAALSREKDERERDENILF